MPRLSAVMHIPSRVCSPMEPGGYNAMTTANRLPKAFDASVIVVTHNNELLIAECLKTIAEAFRDWRCEVIVVDNGSTDRTIAAIPGEVVPTNVIALKENV